MDPRTVGWPSSSLVLGKLSGRAGLRARLEDLGYRLDPDELNEAFEAFKSLADRKREVNDADLEALMSSQRRTVDVPSIYALEQHVQVSCGRQRGPNGDREAYIAGRGIDHGRRHGHVTGRRRLTRR